MTTTQTGIGKGAQERFKMVSKIQKRVLDPLMMFFRECLRKYR